MSPTSISAIAEDVLLPSDPRTALATLFRRQVESQPAMTAVRQAGPPVDYARLDRWSNWLGNQLRARGVTNGDLVALAAEQGPSVIAAVVALIKIGAGYVAIGPDVPIHRQQRFIEQTRPSCLLAQRAARPASAFGLPTVWLDGEPATSESYPPPEPLSDASTEERVFHVVYTSGTTGSPKGVRVGYAAVLNRLRWMWDRYPFSQGSVMGLHKPPTLVASPWEMLGGLLQGIPTEAFSHDEVRDPTLSTDRVLNSGITHLFLTPHLIAGLLTELERRGHVEHRLELVTSGADVLPVEMVRRFHALLPHTTLLNLYGMTETASNIAAYDTKTLPDTAVRVPVGRPVAGAVITIRGRLSGPVPPGMRGEVWVAGPPLALGYVGDDNLTAERFVTDRDQTTWYRTGDLGRWLPDGALEITGRADNQVKIRGYRVELEEVEAVLRNAPGVVEAGVFAELRNNATELVACVTASGPLRTQQLRTYLRERLPDYMVPGRLVQLTDIPRTGNGKLDRQVLSSLAYQVEADSEDSLYQPVDDVEAKVVEIWTALLARPPADSEQDFFDVGGHSLLAVMLANRLEKTFGRRFALRDVLDARTVRALAELARCD